MPMVVDGVSVPGGGGSATTTMMVAHPDGVFEAALVQLMENHRA
jgi:hypothetical protein